MHRSLRHFRPIHELMRIGNHTVFSKEELFTLEMLQVCNANSDKMSKSICVFSSFDHQMTVQWNCSLKCIFTQRNFVKSLTELKLLRP